jgi:F-box-like
MLTQEANERLPFDVLGHIFSYYAIEEMIHYPLETLLLVCKAWSHAAIGHRTLWSNLRIYLEHVPASAIWNARLPLRLARCGPDIPLDVDLRDFLDVMGPSEMDPEFEIQHLVPAFTCAEAAYYAGQVGCSCHIAVRACINRSLRALVGDNGEICARWRSLTLYFGEGGYVDGSNALSCATPILQHLELGRVWVDEESATTHLFPDVRKLKRLSLFDCRIPSLPNCDNLLDASLEWDEPLRRYPDLSALRGANQLQVLSLRSTFNAAVPLPAQLHNLRVLKIDGQAEINNSGLLTCQMPQLSHLSLDDQDTNLLKRVLLCEGLPVEKLTQVTLTWMMHIPHAEYELTAVMETLQVFMTRARGLKRLEVDGEFVSFVIKVLWNSRRHQLDHNLVLASDSAEPLFDTGYLTMILKRETIHFDGTQTPLFLEGLAKRWGCANPSLSNDEFVRRRVSTILPL